MTMSYFITQTLCCMQTQYYQLWIHVTLDALNKSVSTSNPYYAIQTQMLSVCVNVQFSLSPQSLPHRLCACASRVTCYFQAEGRRDCTVWRCLGLDSVLVFLFSTERRDVRCCLRGAWEDNGLPTLRSPVQPVTRTNTQHPVESSLLANAASCCGGFKRFSAAVSPPSPSSFTLLIAPSSHCAFTSPSFQPEPPSPLRPSQPHPPYGSVSSTPRPAVALLVFACLYALTAPRSQFFIMQCRFQSVNLTRVTS